MSNANKNNVDLTYWGGLVLVSGIVFFLLNQYRQWQLGLSNDKPNTINDKPDSVYDKLNININGTPNSSIKNYDI